MRFQFSTRQILLATAFAAITFSGIGGFTSTASFSHVWILWPGFYAGVSAPLWMPIVFVAYAIGRRSFTTSLVVIFALMEFAAVFISFAAWRWVRYPPW
jgi:hypothetical protein